MIIRADSLKTLFQKSNLIINNYKYLENISQIKLHRRLTFVEEK